MALARYGSLCARRKASGVVPMVRRKNFRKFVGSSNPRRSPMTTELASVWTSKRCASSATRRSTSVLAGRPSVFRQLRVKVLVETPRRQASSSTEGRLVTRVSNSRRKRRASALEGRSSGACLATARLNPSIKHSSRPCASAAEVAVISAGSSSRRSRVINCRQVASSSASRSKLLGQSARCERAAAGLGETASAG